MAAEKDTATPDDEPGYEQAREELAAVVAKLEAGGLSLEDSLALWERGESLARTCERHLAGVDQHCLAQLGRVRGSSDRAGGLFDHLDRQAHHLHRLLEADGPREFAGGGAEDLSGQRAPIGGASSACRWNRSASDRFG